MRGRPAILGFVALALDVAFVGDALAQAGGGSSSFGGGGGGGGGGGVGGGGSGDGGPVSVAILILFLLVFVLVTIVGAIGAARYRRKRRARVERVRLEAAARRAVEAWAEAVDGEDAPLEAVASAQAISELLYGGDRRRKTRLVVREPRVKGIRIAGLDARADPATMTIDLELGGRRYVEDRDTAAVVSGSKHSATTFSERWTLALDGPRQTPWRVIRAGAARTQPA